MAAPYILARTRQEANAFAEDELGIGRGYYRIVTSPSSVKGPHGADLYLLPGWQNRHDRFAMQSAIRWTRLNKIDVAEWRLEQAEAPAEPDAAPDDLEPEGDQPYLDGTVTEAAEPAATETPAEEPDKRRRRRCTDCGVLVDPDDIEQHAADHFPSEE